MTPEEKAKAYDEAIKGIKNLITDNDGKINDHAIVSVTDLKGIFPKLVESEEEKIIRTLKEIANWGCAKNISVENNVELKDCIAWLEKQDEPSWKPSDYQLEALESATENCAYSEYQDCLRDLIEQLKKLREK